MRASALALAGLAMLAAACGGGGGGGGAGAPPAPPSASARLAAADVERVVAQAVAEAQARGARAHVAVVDRSGNVLAVYSMPGAPENVTITSGLPSGGLETPTPVVPAPLAAISKAITGAYLSSQGNAFSTRTAGQIIQEHFNPNESRQPAGPLFGVQFSQLTCSDVMRKPANGSVGPKRSPLGLSADPGGLPLYAGGVLVGGVGVEADGLYGIDRELRDVDEAVEELAAVAGAAGFAAPADIRGERITADGRSFRYVDSESLVSDPARASALPASGYRVVAGYFDGLPRAGTAYGSVASGIHAQPGAADGRWIVADAAGENRFAPRAAADGRLSRAEVEAILEEALSVARRARGQIRRPLGLSAEVSVAVVATNGDILGLARTADGPIFGIDVAVQKARTAMFFSHPDAPAELAAAPPAVYLDGSPPSPIASYVTRMAAFAGGAALGGEVAWSVRSIGNVHRPFFPDGIDGTSPGPFSTPIANWSPFNVGLQLDLVNNQLVRGVLGDLSEGCAGRLPASVEAGREEVQIAKLRNGLQVFPGGVPIYRGGDLAGGVGVSGDGVDQDDMIAFLGLHQAAARLGTGFGHAPPERRSDRLAPHGTRLRYVQCPQAPFLGSEVQDACAGK
jgi:uncharacterized protein GlcG (DUF336 family)